MLLIFAEVLTTKTKQNETKFKRLRGSITICVRIWNDLFNLNNFIVMRNLLSKLKPEYLELLEVDSEKYPYLITSIKTELSNNYFFTELSVNTAFQICNFCKLNFGLVELHSLFLRDE